MDNTKIEDLLNDWKSQFDAARTDRPGGLTPAQVRFFLRFLDYIEDRLARDHGEVALRLPKPAADEVQHERLRRSRSNRGMVVERDDRQADIIPFPTDEDFHG